jgi:hypothetical protein
MKRSSPAASDRDHSILPEARQYGIIGVRLELAPEDGGEPFLDLTLRRGNDRRVLRFFSPRDIEIEKGGPVNGGLRIVDVSGRQLDNVGVRVDDSEAAPGSIRFWARDVASV